MIYQLTSGVLRKSRGLRDWRVRIIGRTLRKLVMIKLCMLSLLTAVWAANNPLPIDSSNIDHWIQDGAFMLQNGGYIIARKLPYNPHEAKRMRFDSAEEANAWIQETQTMQDSREPPVESQEYTAYFEIYKNERGFVIRQMLLENGEYSPRKNFFVSISEDGSWVYQERIDQVFKLEGVFTKGTNVGPFTGILVSAVEFYESLTSFGLNRIDWPSISLYDDDMIKGRMFRDHEFSGFIERNVDGLIRRMTYVDDLGTEQRIEFEYGLNERDLSAVTFQRRNGSGGWSLNVGFQIMEVLEKPEDINFADYWDRHSTPETRVFVYDKESRVVKYHDEAGNERIVASEVRGAPERVSDERGADIWMIIALVGIGLGLPLILLIVRKSV